MIQFYVKFTGDSSYTNLADYNGHDLINQTFEADSILCDQEFKPAQSELKIDVLYSSALFIKLLAEEVNIPCYVTKNGTRVFSGFANCDLSISFSNAKEILSFRLYDNSAILQNKTTSLVYSSGLTTLANFAAIFLSPYGVAVNFGNLDSAAAMIPSYIVEAGETLQDVAEDILWHLGITFYFDYSGQMCLVQWNAAPGSSVDTLTDQNGKIIDKSFSVEVEGMKERQTATSEIKVESFQKCRVKEYKLGEFQANTPHVLGSPIGIDYGSEPSNRLIQYAHIYQDNASLDLYTQVNKLSGVEKILSLSNLWLGARGYSVFGYKPAPGYTTVTFGKLAYKLTPHVIGTVGDTTGETVYNRNYAQGNPANVNIRPFLRNWALRDQDGVSLGSGNILEASQIRFTGNIHGDNFAWPTSPGGAWAQDRKFMGLTELRAYADIEYLKKKEVSIQADLSFDASSAYLIYDNSWVTNIGNSIKSNIINSKKYKIKSYQEYNLGDVLTIQVAKNNLSFGGRIIRKSYRYANPSDYMKGVPVEYEYELVSTVDVTLLNPALGDVTEYSRQVPGPTLSPWISEDGTLAIPVDSSMIISPTTETGAPIDVTLKGIKIDSAGLRFYHPVSGDILVKFDVSGSATFSGTIHAAAGDIGGWAINSTNLQSSGGLMTLKSSGTVQAGVGNDVAIMSAEDATYRFWAGQAAAADAPFSVTKAGALKATSGEVGGFVIGTNSLASGVAGTARLLLDKGNMRMAVLDSSDVVKTAMGYLGGLPRNGVPWQAGKNYAIGDYVYWATTALTYRCIFSSNGSQPNNATYWVVSSDTWASSNYGFWMRAGNSLAIDGNVSIMGGDWLIQNDSSYLIKNGSYVLARLGTFAGFAGLFLNESAWNGGAPTGYTCRVTPSDFYVGDGTNYIKFNSGALEISGSSLKSNTTSTQIVSTNLSFTGASEFTGGVGISGNLHVSKNGATGGGITLSDDGDIVDLNDGYCSMRFSNGVRVYSGKSGGSNAITLGANGTVSCNIVSCATASVNDLVTATATGIRMVQGNYGVMFRNDGSTFYILLTDSGNSGGGWNSLRPFVLSLSTGKVTMQNGLDIAGGLYTAGSQVFCNGSDVYYDSGSRLQLKQNLQNGAGSNMPGLTMYRDSGSTGDVFVTFHMSGTFACQFGLDSGTNDLFVGGWSFGTNKYRVWHAGNIKKHMQGHMEGNPIASYDLFTSLSPLVPNTGDSIKINGKIGAVITSYAYRYSSTVIRFIGSDGTSNRAIDVDGSLTPLSATAVAW